MERDEKSYTFKEAKDLLGHIKQERMNYCAFPPVADISEGSGGASAEDNAWQYFEELSERSKFLMLFHILNEKSFKSTVFNLLNMIKMSQYPQMNASFLCLSKHIEHIYETSLFNLGNVDDRDEIEGGRVSQSFSTTLTSTTGGGVKLLGGDRDSDRMVELDPNFTWHPEASEHLLHNITIPSSCGGMGHFPAVASNLQLAASSLVGDGTYVVMSCLC